MTRTIFRACAAAPLIGLVACSAETLDAGTNYVLKVAEEPVVERASMPRAIDAVAMDGESLYFTCEDGWVYRLAKSGSESAQKLASFPGNYAKGLAVDDSNVYFTALADGYTGGVVMRAPKGGGAATTLASSQSRPWGIAVDDSQIYWVEQGANPDDNDTGSGLREGDIVAMPKSGASGGAKARVLVSHVLVGDQIALDEEGVYWHELNSMDRVSKEGGPPLVLTSSLVATASSNLLVANGEVSWANEESGVWSILSVATTGGSPATLVANIDPPSSLALLGSTIFWSDAEGSSVGAIRSVPFGGGTQSILSPPSTTSAVAGRSVSFVLVDASSFFTVQSWVAPTLHVVVDELVND